MGKTKILAVTALFCVAAVSSQAARRSGSYPPDQAYTVCSLTGVCTASQQYALGILKKCDDWKTIGVTAAPLKNKVMYEAYNMGICKSRTTVFCGGESAEGALSAIGAAYQAADAEFTECTLLPSLAAGNKCLQSAQTKLAKTETALLLSQTGCNSWTHHYLRQPDSGEYQQYREEWCSSAPKKWAQERELVNRKLAECKVSGCPAQTVIQMKLHAQSLLLRENTRGKTCGTSRGRGGAAQGTMKTLQPINSRSSR